MSEVNPIDYSSRHPTLRSRIRIPLDGIITTLLAGSITLAISLVSYSLLDVSLGTIFATITLVGLFSVGIAQAVHSLQGWAVMSVVIASASVVPIFLGVFDHPELAAAGAQLLLMGLVLAAIMLAIPCALGHVLPQGVASAGAVTIWLAWLTWPVWMSPYFHSQIGGFFVDHLLAHQPLFAIAAAYPAMGDWTHAPIAYSKLTNLGQSVMFAPPSTAWPAIASHAVVAVILGLLAFAWRKKTKVEIKSAPQTKDPAK